jgi:hypothetical protein
VIGILTGLSWLTAFAYDEGTTYESIGIIGYYSFHIFRFPSHNIIWLKPELIGKWFFPGLLINVVFYASLITTVLIFYRKIKREK